MRWPRAVRSAHAKTAGLVPTANALKSRWYKTNIERAGALSPMLVGSNCSLQAHSPCATTAALCLPAAMPTHLMPLAPGATHTNSCKHAYMMLTAHARVMRSGIIWRLFVDELSRRDVLKRCS